MMVPVPVVMRPSLLVGQPAWAGDPRFDRTNWIPRGLIHHGHRLIPVDQPPPPIGLQGLGQLVCPDYPDTSSCYDDGSGSSGSGNNCLFGVDASGQCVASPGVSLPPSPTPSGGLTPAQIASLISATGTVTAASINAAAGNVPRPAVLPAKNTALLTVGSGGVSGAIGANLLPIVLIVGLGIVLMAWRK